MWSVVVVNSKKISIEIQLYYSEEDAIEASMQRGGAWVVEGSQLWNKKLGKIQEHNGATNYTWYS